MVSDLLFLACAIGDLDHSTHRIQSQVITIGFGGVKNIKMINVQSRHKETRNLGHVVLLFERLCAAKHIRVAMPYIEKHLDQRRLVPIVLEV